MSNFLDELKRRNVIKAAISYVVVSWAIIQVSQILFETFEIPTTALRYVLYTLIGGFPLWIIFVYRFEWTPTGFMKTEDVAPEASVTKQTGKKLNNIIISGLVVAVLLLLADRFFGITVPNNEINKPEKSIAVLPFVNMSKDENQEYFSDGLSEELLNLLAKIPDLKVIARTSSFAFKGKNEDLRTIGAKLGVAHVLEGSVRKSGNTLRITAQLIKVADGSHLWSETYDRTFDDIFKVQDEIADAVVSQLKLRLLGRNLPTSTKMEPEAYNLFMEGKFFSGRMSKENLEKAETKFKEALALDPAAGPIWAELASVYTLQGGFAYKPLDEGIHLAKKAVAKALELDPYNARAHSSLARIYINYDWAFDEGEVELRKALELDPGNAAAINNSAILALSLGRLDATIAFGKQAIEADPLKSNFYHNMGRYYLFNSDWANAEKNLSKALELAPDRSGTRYQISIVQLLSGREQEALVTISREKDDMRKIVLMPLIYFKLNRKEADIALKTLIEKYSNEAAYQIAEAYAYRREIDKAFEWLERAYQQHDGGLTEVLPDPLMRNLNNDPRWLVFLKKMRLNNYWPEYKAKYLDKKSV